MRYCLFSAFFLLIFSDKQIKVDFITYLYIFNLNVNMKKLRQSLFHNILFLLVKMRKLSITTAEVKSGLMGLYNNYSFFFCVYILLQSKWHRVHEYALYIHICIYVHMYILCIYIQIWLCIIALVAFDGPACCSIFVFSRSCPPFLGACINIFHTTTFL